MATDTVVLSDNDGNYYLLSRQMIESAKVTDSKQKDELAKSAQGGDTSGFTTFGAMYSPISLGGTQLKLVGACSCNFSFDRLGILSR